MSDKLASDPKKFWHLNLATFLDATSLIPVDTNMKQLMFICIEKACSVPDPTAKEPQPATELPADKKKGKNKNPKSDIWLPGCNRIPNTFGDDSHEFKLHFEEILPMEFNDRITHLTILHSNEKDLLKAFNTLKRSEKSVQYLELVLCNSHINAGDYTERKTGFTVTRAETGVKDTIERLVEKYERTPWWRKVKGLNYVESKVSTRDAYDDADDDISQVGDEYKVPTPKGKEKERKLKKKKKKNRRESSSDSNDDDEPPRKRSRGSATSTNVNEGADYDIRQVGDEYKVPTPKENRKERKLKKKKKKIARESSTSESEIEDQPSRERNKRKPRTPAKEQFTSDTSSSSEEDTSQESKDPNRRSVSRSHSPLLEPLNADANTDDAANATTDATTDATADATKNKQQSQVVASSVGFTPVRTPAERMADHGKDKTPSPTDTLLKIIGPVQPLGDEADQPPMNFRSSSALARNSKSQEPSKQRGNSVPVSDKRYHSSRPKNTNRQQHPFLQELAISGRDRRTHSPRRDRSNPKKNRRPDR